jgi:hypothetical protein
MLEFETEFVNFASGSLVVCWDGLFEKTQDPRDMLDCHGKIGTVIRKASPADLSTDGIPIGKMANKCIAVLFDGDEVPKLVHSQWLKVVERDVN